MSGLVILITTFACWICHQSGYLGLVILHLELFSLIIRMFPVYVFFIGITLGNVQLNLLNKFLFFILIQRLQVTLISGLIYLASFLDAIRMYVSTVSLIQKNLESVVGRIFSFNL